MKKSIITLSFLLSTLVHADINEQLVKKLSEINSQSMAPDCNTCQMGSKDYTPQDALSDINGGNLVFMGRELFPGSDQNRTCVYKTPTAYILYNNCMASKKEAVATNIEIISFNGGIMKFYIENKGDTPISTMVRSQYDSTWTVSYTPSKPPGTQDMNGLKNFMEAHSVANAGGGCYVGGSFNAQNMSTRGNCYGKMKGKGDQWNSEAEQFWRDPGDKWYEGLKSLRKTVVGTKF